MIQQMLASWSLVPLPFLSPACTSGILSSHTVEAWLEGCWALPWLPSPSHAHYFPGILSHSWVTDDTILSQAVGFHSLVLFPAIIIFLLQFSTQYKCSYLITWLPFIMNFLKFFFLKLPDYKAKLISAFSVFPWSLIILL